MIQFAALMVPLGMTKLWRINPVSQEAYQQIDFRTSASRRTDFLGCCFPLIKYVYNTKARCYLNIFPHFQILSLGPPAFFNRLKQDLGKIYSAKF